MGNGYEMGKVGQGQAYGVPRMESRVKVRMENRKVMDTNQGSLETKMGRGQIRIGVPVWGYTECNSISLLD